MFRIAVEKSAAFLRKVKITTCQVTVVFALCKAHGTVKHMGRFLVFRIAVEKSAAFFAKSQNNNLSSHGSICFANLHLKGLTERCFGFWEMLNPK